MQRAMILEELAFSQRIVREGHQVVPRFRVVAPDGEHAIKVQLLDDPETSRWITTIRGIGYRFETP